MSNARSRMGAFGRTPKDLLRDGSLSARAKVVVALIDEVAGHEEVTMERLAEWLGCTVDTARRAVHEARDAGWIEVHEQYEAGRRVASQYVANGYAHQGGDPEESGVRPSENQEGALVDSGRTSPPKNRGGNNETNETKKRHATPTTTPPKKGTRLDEAWEPGDVLREWAREHTPGLDVDEETERFRDYWCARAGQGATKVDWDATWRNWMRRTFDERPQARRAAPDVRQTDRERAEAEENERRKRAWLAERGSSVEEYERRKDEPGWLASLQAMVTT